MIERHEEPPIESGVLRNESRIRGIPSRGAKYSLTSLTLLLTIAMKSNVRISARRSQAQQTTTINPRPKYAHLVKAGDRNIERPGGGTSVPSTNNMTRTPIATDSPNPSQKGPISQVRSIVQMPHTMPTDASIASTESSHVERWVYTKMAVSAKPRTRMPRYIGLLRLPVTLLFVTKPTRRMSSVPVATRGRSVVIARCSDTSSHYRGFPSDVTQTMADSRHHGPPRVIPAVWVQLTGRV